ncbi:hypothetical protein IAQ61_001327, partial [Plenodomus lingam]|uniref:uncharacterized protein n=1 Tax=Leptosphaeria maculans TaxID=5022 RepID=UPI00332FBE20
MSTDIPSRINSYKKVISLIKTAHTGTLLSAVECIVTGGSRPQTVNEAIKNIVTILEEAGTSLDNGMEIIMFIANKSDYTAMNECYRLLSRLVPPWKLENYQAAFL